MNNWKLYIANRIHFDKQHRKKATPPAVRVAVAGVALGLAIMILSVAIVIGFKKEIRSKVVGFGAHIQITSFDNNMTYEKQPIQYTDSLREILSECDDITKIDPIGTKLGMIKTDTDFMGTVLKGVTPDYNWSFFKKYLVDGCLPKIQDSIISNEVLVSKTIADKLDLHIGDKIYCYFVQEQVRARRFSISGIYQTDFSDYDKLLIIGDVRHVQRLNDWNPDQYSEIELMIKDFDRADDIAYELYTQLIDRPDDYGTHYYPQSIRTLNPVFFGWLDLLDMNVWIILILMAAVSGFTMISGLLIIILERANMIGILKALGAKNIFIRIGFPCRERYDMGEYYWCRPMPDSTTLSHCNTQSRSILRTLCSYRNKFLVRFMVEHRLHACIGFDADRTFLFGCAYSPGQIYKIRISALLDFLLLR